MRVLLSWLCDYVEWTGTGPELARVLTEVGLAVSRVEPLDHSDAILEIDVTSNRGDCMSHLGISRELGAALGQACRSVVLPDAPRVTAEVPPARLVAVDVEASDLCTAYCARTIEEVAPGAPTPSWIGRRLARLGHRSVNAVVDITNFVLLARGQPLHAFDRDRIRGGRIVVRRSRSGERIELLDGRVRNLPEGLLIIADAERPIAVAGVMGGRDTEVGPTTTAVVLESARFAPTAVRAACAALGIQTEASMRFSRRVDPAECERSSLRACALIEDAAGGRVAAGAMHAGPGWDAAPSRRVGLRFARVDRLLGGPPVPPEEIRAVLYSLGFAEVSRDPAGLVVEVPSHRSDVTAEVDLIEEVARIRGYDRIPARLTLPVRSVAPRRASVALDRVRAALGAAGFREALTLPFVAPGLPDDAAPWPSPPAVRVENPVRAEDPLLRRSLLGPLLRSLERNRARGVAGARLFEESAVFLPGAQPGDRPREARRLAAVLDGEYDVARGAADAVMLALRVSPVWEGIPAGTPTPPPFREGHTARARIGAAVVGFVGEVDGAHVSRLHVHREGFRAAVFELDFDALLAAAPTAETASEPPSHPEVVRDVAVVVADDVPWSRVAGLSAEVAGPMLRSVVPFDVYRGPAVPPGNRSIAFRLVFGGDDRTLTGEEVDAGVAAVLERLGRELGVSLRGSG